MTSRYDNGTIASLLPYLARNGENPSGGLSLTVGDPSDSGKRYPFSVLNDSGPAARLVEAAFVTDAGSILKKVFLLLQKDRYALRHDELWPVTNPVIDGIWWQAFSFHSEAGKERSAMTVLSAQKDGDGGLKLLASLFFCAKRELFFHPPCPLCGIPLQLCKDDDLLAASGLRPYSDSLKRYLYCAGCGTQGPEGFYINEREHDDPPSLKDKWSLIEEFASLLGSSDPASSLPCIRCPEHDACYGANGMARSRIIPFSFYPFYLLIFDAVSLNALDFLPLLSGATFDELEGSLVSRNEIGRLNSLRNIRAEGFACGFLHSRDDERFFAEVLYLKLSFLGDVLHRFLDRGDIAEYPDLRPSIDRVWLDLPDGSGLLPSLWNFRARVLDLVNPSLSSRNAPDRPSSNLLFYLGLLWFHVILANSKQGNNEIFSVLINRLSNKAEISGGIIPQELSNTIFAPENIFWDPQGKKVGTNWRGLWENTVELGLCILRSATGHDRHWTENSFFEFFEGLRSDVKKSMFMNTPSFEQESVHDDGRSGDTEICNILKGIIVKWGEGEKTSTPPVTCAEDVELTETVILAPEQGVTSPASPLEEEFTETVILSSTPLHSVPPVTAEEDAADDFLAETIILSPEMRLDSLSAKDAPREEVENTAAVIHEPGEDHDLAETVILSPRKVRNNSKDGGTGNE